MVSIHGPTTRIGSIHVWELSMGVIGHTEVASGCEQLSLRCLRSAFIGRL